MPLRPREVFFLLLFELILVAIYLLEGGTLSVAAVSGSAALAFGGVVLVALFLLQGVLYLFVLNGTRKGAGTIWAVGIGLSVVSLAFSLIEILAYIFVLTNVVALSLNGLVLYMFTRAQTEAYFGKSQDRVATSPMSRKTLLVSLVVSILVGSAILTSYYAAGRPGNASFLGGSLCQPFCASAGNASLVVSTLYLNSTQPAQQAQVNFLCMSGALQSTLPSPGFVSSSSNGTNGGPGVTLQYCGVEGFSGPTVKVWSLNLTLYYKEAPPGVGHFVAYLTGVPCQPRDYDPFYPLTGTSCYISKSDVPIDASAPTSGDCARTTFSWTPSGVTLAKGEPLSLVLFFPHEVAGSQGPYSQSVKVCKGSNASVPGAQVQDTPSSITIKGEAATQG